MTVIDHLIALSAWMTESLYHRLIGNETNIDGAVPRELPYTAVLQGRSLWVEVAAALPQQETVIDAVLPADGESLLLQKTLQFLRLEHGIHHRLLFCDVSGRIAVIEDAVVVNDPQQLTFAAHPRDKAVQDAPSLKGKASSDRSNPCLAAASPFSML